MKQYIFIADTDQFKSSNQEPCATCSQTKKYRESSQSQTLNIQSIQTSTEDIASMENSRVQN